MWFCRFFRKDQNKENDAPLPLTIDVDLRDHENISHKIVQFKLEGKMDIAELKSQIFLNLGIFRDDQEITDKNGRRVDLLPGTLKENGVSDGETLYLKHSDLSLWIYYKKSLHEFAVATRRYEKNHHAQDADLLYDALTTSNIRSVYPAFLHECDHKPILRFLDMRPESVSNFFKLEKYHGPNADIGFHDMGLEKTKGTRGPIMCIVGLDSVFYNYRVKTSRSTSFLIHRLRGVHVMELYCYKLLEAIGVGAKVFLIPSCDPHKSEVYIASEMMLGFVTFDYLPLDEADSEKVRYALVQVHFLASFLDLEDVYDHDFGLHEDYSPRIVGLSILRTRDPKSTFLFGTSFGMLDEPFQELLRSCPPAERFRIAKESLKAWDFETKLYDVLDLMKEEIRSFGPIYHKHETDVERYVDEIRSFVRQLQLLETTYVK